MSVIFDSLSCQWKDVKNFITVSEFSNTTIKQFIVMSEDEVLKLQEKSSNRQWKSFAIAINVILLQVLVAFLLIQVYQQKQEIENLKAIEARYHYLSYLLERGVIPFSATKWKSVQIEDPDPKSDSIKL